MSNPSCHNAHLCRCCNDPHHSDSTRGRTDWTEALDLIEGLARRLRETTPEYLADDWATAGITFVRRFRGEGKIGG